MIYRITHSTQYESKDKISIGMNQVFLTPRPTPWQQIKEARIQTQPAPTFEDHRIDYFGNQINYFSFERGYYKLDIEASSLVSASKRELTEQESSPTLEQLKLQLSQTPVGSMQMVREMMFPSPFIAAGDERIRQYAAASFPSDRPLLIGLTDLLARFSKDFEFDPEATTINTPVAEVFENRRGVCQDFAHTLLAMCRAIKLPARYVSGYIRTIPPEGKPRLRGADASHAWVSLYCGDKLGWVDIDPTNNCFVGSDHITVAWGRDYSDVAPVRGVVIGAGTHKLKVEVDVEPVAEQPISA